MALVVVRHHAAVRVVQRGHAGVALGRIRILCEPKKISEFFLGADPSVSGEFIKSECMESQGLIHIFFAFRDRLHET